MHCTFVLTLISCDCERWDHQAPEWLTATEYQDTEQAKIEISQDKYFIFEKSLRTMLPKVVADKVERLIALLKLSKNTVVYTGQGETH